MESVVKFVREVNSTNSNLEKKDILKKYMKDPIVTKVIIYTLDPLMQFNVSSSNVKKFKKNKKYFEQEFPIYNCLFKLLDDLSSRVITGNIALKAVNEFIKELKKDVIDIVYCILDKNLKIRMNKSTINKVYGKNIIKEFEPVLAYKFDSKCKLNSSWSISRKLDGVRCLIHIDTKKSNIRAYSRQGKDLYNLDSIFKSISIEKMEESVFLDGELVHIEDGIEDFKKTIEIVRKSKNVDKLKGMENLYYKVFDMIPESEFYNTKGKTLFRDRYKKLVKLFSSNDRIQIIEQVPYNDESFIEMKQKVEKLGWEGLMLRDNKPYKGKRIKDLLKVKSFQDAEFKVLEVINGPIRVIDSNTGLESTIECLSAVVIDYKNTKVGSGFSIEERKEYYKDPSKIVGKTITVQYFEKTPDSLRFPVFKGIRDYE